MFNVVTEINWLAVLASTVVFAVVGGLYFSVIVAKPYAEALGNENKQLPKPGPIFIVGPLISSLVVVITSAVLLKVLSVEALGDGIVFGLIVGIGYLVAQTFNIAINPNFPRPILYGLINAPYFIICAVIASIILTVWR
jgi:Protein of unknown function (DUF1761)